MSTVLDSTDPKIIQRLIGEEAAPRWARVQAAHTILGQRHRKQWWDFSDDARRRYGDIIHEAEVALYALHPERMVPAGVPPVGIGGPPEDTIATPIGRGGRRRGWGRRRRLH